MSSDKYNKVYEIHDLQMYDLQIMFKELADSISNTVCQLLNPCL